MSCVMSRLVACCSTICRASIVTLLCLAAATFFGQFRQHGHLAEELARGYRRESDNLGARRNVPKHATLRRDSRTVADRQMAGDTAVSGNHDMVADLGTSADSDHGDDDRAAPDL